MTRVLKIASHVSEHDSSKVSPLVTEKRLAYHPTDPSGTPSGCRKSTKYRTDNRMDTLIAGILDKIKNGKQHTLGLVSDTCHEAQKSVATLN